MRTAVMSRRRMLMECGLMLVAGVLAPHAVAAGGGGMNPVTDIYVAPGVTAAIVSFNTVMARDATLVIWSDDVPQSYRTLEDPSVGTFHSITLASLKPDTPYHYEIRLHNTPSDFFVAFASVLHTRRPMARNAATATLPDGQVMTVSSVSIDDVDIVDAMTAEGWELRCLFPGGVGPAVGTSFTAPVPQDVGTVEWQSLTALAVDRHASDVLTEGTYVTMDQWIANGDFTPLPAGTVIAVGLS